MAIMAVALQRHKLSSAGVDLTGRSSTDDSEQDALDEELRTQPLLESVRSLVNKERELAGLQLEEKDREAELWRAKFLQLQDERGDQYSNAKHHSSQPVDGLEGISESCQGGEDDDWDNLQAASKKAGDSYLVKLKRKENIDLSRRGIGVQDLDGMIVKLKWLRGFTSVDLSSNKIDDACAPALRSLMALKQLRRLDLRANDFGPSAGAAVLESLTRCRSLQVLRLEANMIFARTPGMGARLASCLRAALKAGACRHLWSLSVTVDDFDGKFMNAPRVAGATKRRTQDRQRSSKGSKEESREGIERGTGTVANQRKMVPPRTIPAHPMNALELARAFHPRAPNGGAGALLNEDGNTVVGDGTRRGDRPFGAGRGSITSLGLPYARLHPRSVQEIATHAIASLTYLDLSHCYTGPAGAHALARALDTGGRGSRSLRCLQLLHNAIGDSGACTLSRALANNRRLTSLNITSNSIGPAGGRALASMFGGDSVVLVHLSVGDNPLGDQSARMLVAAADAATPSDRSSSGGGTGGGLLKVRIIGLDKVAGATVATKETARRAAEAVEPCESDSENNRLDPRKGGEYGTDRTEVALSVVEEVHVRPEDAVGRDGFVLVYRITLDSRFRPPADKITGDSGKGGNVVLDVRWLFAVAGSEERTGVSTASNNCEWRVSRCREGEAEFLVKEGVASGRGTAVPIDDGRVETKDGYSPARLMCNGWRQHDVVKIFSRPARGGRSSCCDLTIRLVQGALATMYGVVWADPDFLGSCERHGWRQENRPRIPTFAECEHVAFHMCQAHPKGAWTNCDADCTRLRQVYLSSGGRIRASWQAVLAGAQCSQATAPNSAIRNGGGSRGWRPDGYSWAIVRTRGVAGDDGEGAAPGAPFLPPPTKVIDQGVIRPPHGPSPWQWQSCEVDTAGWLPGDLLSLWIQVDHGGHGSRISTDAPHATAFNSCTVRTGAVDSGAAGLFTGARNRASDGTNGQGDSLLPYRQPANKSGGRGSEVGACFRPCVRGFELRVVDDATAEEIARRACFRRHGSAPVGTVVFGGKNRSSKFADGVGVSVGGTTGTQAGGSHSRAGTNVVRLDLAPVCPMNLAAAGGSWA